MQTAEMEIMSAGGFKLIEKLYLSRIRGFIFLDVEFIARPGAESMEAFHGAKSSVCAGIWRNAGGRFG